MKLFTSAVIAALLCCCLNSRAQQTLKGAILDKEGLAMPYATATLLKPSDSTLAYFGISNDQGQYEIKNVKPGTYLLQSAYLGYKQYYKKIEVPVENGLIPAIVMQQEDRDLKTVEIAAERVPMMIKGDTVEYNAGAFKTKPDANVEELLKKLPGVSVDRSGNIKAQGEDVKKVLVDGKEFFSNDPKIATKNLPADAIKKVQVYDKKSDQSEFTGVDDGSRDKTVNLVLKDDRKNGYFGDLIGGYGTDNKYQGSGKLYNFKPTSQFAALGMVNNINQFGFSVSDYITFKGGIGNLMSGGGLNFNSSMPINFGQPVNGLITSGAGGLNYTYEPVKNRRFNISYLGNASKNRLQQSTYSRNFTNDGTFERNRTSTETSRDNGHSFAASLRNDMDSVNQLTAGATAGFTRGNSNSKAFTESLIEKTAFNSLDNSTLNSSKGISGSANAAYVSRLGKNWPMLKLSADGDIDQSISGDEWTNLTSIFEPTPASFTITQFQKNNTNQLGYGGSALLSRRLGKGFFLDGSLTARMNDDHYTRKQGTPPEENFGNDSLSVDFRRNVFYTRPAISIEKNNDKTRFSAALALENGTINSNLVNTQGVSTTYNILLPRLRWEYEYMQGKRIGMRYESSVNSPNISELQPVVNNANPLSLFSGNQFLRPEQLHTGGINWLWFDQFSFTSIFANLSGTYTHDKINMARSVDQNLAQRITYVNVDDDYRAELDVNFSTPIRKLGLMIELGFNEAYNRSLTPVNGLTNINTNYTHGAELTLKNRNTDKISASVGALVKYTEAQYSIQADLNNKYYSIGLFTDLNYTPTDHWNFSFTADVSRYQSQSFSNAVSIPLLQAEVSRFFMKANRASVSLKAFDILNQNSGIQRVSELNYLQETRSNIIGRYVMISLKYKLSKLGSSGGPNVKIDIKNR